MTVHDSEPKLDPRLNGIPVIPKATFSEVIGFPLLPEKYKYFSIVISLIYMMAGSDVFAELKLQPLKEIHITGNQGIETDTIQFSIKSKIGEPIDPFQVRRDIRTLYKTGFFNDISVSIDKVEGGVSLTFIVDERPIITDIVLSGYKKISQTTLNDELTIKSGDRYDPVKVNESINKLENKYRERGYQYAMIIPRLSAVRKGTASLVFAIDEGDKIKIKDIKFTGVKAFTAGNRFWGLRSKMKENREYWMFSWITSSGTIKEDLLQDDIKAIEDFYKNKGYLRVSIDDPEIIVEKPDPKKAHKKKQKITIVLHINEGEIYRLGEITAKVSDEKIFTSDLVLNIVKSTRLEKIQKILGGSAFFRAGPRFEKGKEYSLELETEAITQVSDLYGSRGYIYANIDPVKEIDDINKIVDITFTVIEGTPAFLHRLEFAGNSRTRDRVLRRNFMLLEGDIFNTALVKQSIARIQYLSYIDDVVPQVIPQVDPSQVDVIITHTDNKQTEIQLAGGYSGYDKFYGTLGLSEHNFFGRGQEFSISGTAGKRTKTFQVSFSDEWIFDRPYYGSISLWNSSRDYDYSDRRSIGGSLVGGRSLKYNLSARLGYKYEVNTVYNIDDNAEQEIKDLKGDQITSSLTATLIRDTLDNRMDPTKGNHASASFEFAGSFLGGENDFYKSNFSWSFYHRLPKNLVFALRSEVNYANGMNGQELPFYERFRLGGPMTVRGYRERSIGPWDEYGQNLGGNKSLLFGSEIQIPIAGPLKTVLFADAGDTYIAKDPFDIRTLRPSVGVEVRFLVPGFYIPLRFIWGYNLDPYEGESRNDFQFTMGTML